MSTDRPLRVLESVSELRPTTNPYLVQLIDALRARDDVDVRLFSFRRALFTRYDVFHVHWPEVSFGGANRWGRTARRALMTLVLARLALTRTPIVRTWHNTERPAGLGRWDHRLLDGVDRRTKVVIRLNDVTEPGLSAPVHTVPLGHYRQWYAGRAAAPAEPGRVAYVGLVRRYKGVEDLIAAFRGVTTPGAVLAVSGRPSSADLAQTLRTESAGDDRIRLRLEFLDDDDFVREITAATVVALPFVHMHNSSTVLAALSLDRPVLVPDNEVNRRLAEEAGPGWVHLYAGTLTSADIDRALAARVPTGSPRFELRDWDDSARLHVDAFRAATARR